VKKGALRGATLEGHAERPKTRPIPAPNKRGVLKSFTMHPPGGRHGALRDTTRSLDTLGVALVMGRFSVAGFWNHRQEEGGVVDLKLISLHLCGGPGKSKSKKNRGV